MKTVVILQSNYIPWKGYFDLIRDADLFIFHDDLQYTKNDWRNRNRIKTAGGPVWLTIPVGTREDRLICEVGISDHTWAAKHWRIITQHYAKAPFFKRYKDFFEGIYLEQNWDNLSKLNQHLIKEVSRRLLGITTEFKDSREFALQGKKLDRLLELLKKAQASAYVSGPSGKGYIDAVQFDAAGIQLRYKSYDGYPEYPQFHPPFEHSVSIIDLLFHVGPDAPYYIWGWRDTA